MDYPNDGSLTTEFHVVHQAALAGILWVCHESYTWVKTRINFVMRERAQRGKGMWLQHNKQLLYLAG